jgi:hypothetical protein
MKYIEAVTVLKQNLNKTFIGIYINKAKREVTIITLDADDEDGSQHLSASYSSGRLFDSCGTLDYFELDEIPEDIFDIVNSMNFFEHVGLKFNHEAISEYALCEVLPELECGQGELLERNKYSVDAFLTKAQAFLNAK